MTDGVMRDKKHRFLKHFRPSKSLLMRDFGGHYWHLRRPGLMVAVGYMGLGIGRQTLQGAQIWLLITVSHSDF
jgi:hypothetical protein